MVFVREAKVEDEAGWNNYCRKHALSHHALSFSWSRILSSVFHHTPYYLMAFESDVENSAVSGILPLFLFRSMLFGKAFISLPYLNAGGIHAESKEAFDLLVKTAIELVCEHQADYLELRFQKEQPELQNLTSRSHKASMILELKASAEELFTAFPPKLRSQIRRPSKSGVYAEAYPWGGANKSALSDFYAVFAEHMRDLGTPVYPKKLFETALGEFPSTARIIVVRHQGKPISAGITLGFGERTEMPWAASLRAYNKMSPNMLLYWEAIKQACLDGYKEFDFGRSTKDSGTYRFKAQWGAKPRELFWYYYLPSGSELPDVNPQNPKYSLMVNTWKRLPLWIANTLGPRLTRNLP